MLQYVLKQLVDGDRSMIHLVVVRFQEKGSRSEERREVR